MREVGTRLSCDAPARRTYRTDVIYEIAINEQAMELRLEEQRQPAEAGNPVTRRGRCRPPARAAAGA